MPPRSASTRFGLYSLNGFVASMSTRCVLDIRPGSGEQDIVEARRHLDGGRGCAAPKLGNLAAKRVWTSPAAQHHFMASGEGFPRDRSATAPAPIVPNFMMQPPGFLRNKEERRRADLRG